MKKGVGAHGICVIKETVWCTYGIREKRRDISEDVIVVDLVNFDQSPAGMNEEESGTMLVLEYHLLNE